MRKQVIHTTSETEPDLQPKLEELACKVAGRLSESKRITAVDGITPNPRSNSVTAFGGCTEGTDKSHLAALVDKVGKAEEIVINAGAFKLTVALKR